MARHASLPRSTARRVLVALATASAALGAGATAAAADTLPVLGGTYEAGSPGKVGPRAGLRAPTGMVGHATGPVADLKPNPLAGTGVAPLDNGVGARLADFRPLNSRTLTGPVAEAPSVGGVPVLVQAATLLNHRPVPKSRALPGSGGAALGSGVGLGSVGRARRAQ
ncbi:hypothetical protein GCM10010510_10710 [Streptomyces anandii JCM 4720]|nr:hypothetical protein [Streptomyces anandii]GGX68076.1 hypothetical protein GCM10010510_10710 [Streptomyces anandii JCM 4720]